jgi:hypothetical protein
VEAISIKESEAVGKADRKSKGKRQKAKGKNK